MTKDELQTKRAVALRELKDIEVALCLDEHYIDIVEKEKAELEKRLVFARAEFQRQYKENAELKEKLTAIRNAKDKYDLSKDKSIIKAFGAEYTLFCDLERNLEE